MLLLPSPADLFAKHTDLVGVRVCVCGGDGLIPQAACLKMAYLQITPPLPPLPRPFFLHLWGNEGFVNVCSSQMPALSNSFCSCERKGESCGNGSPLSSRLGVVCYWCFIPTLCAIGWCMGVCVNGPAIVLSDCWNAVEWWLHQF